MPLRYRCILGDLKLKSSTLDTYENMFMSINLCQSDTLYIYDYLD